MSTVLSYREEVLMHWVYETCLFLCPSSLLKISFLSIPYNITIIISFWVMWFSMRVCVCVNFKLFYFLWIVCISCIFNNFNGFEEKKIVLFSVHSHVIVFTHYSPVRYNFNCRSWNLKKHNCHSVAPLYNNFNFVKGNNWIQYCLLQV